MSEALLRAHDIYAELEALPANMVGEIVHGTLHAQHRPATKHARAAAELHGELNGPFRRGRGGPGGWVFLLEEEVRLGPHTLVPDISVWRAVRYATVHAETTPFTAVPPDWLCEVLSPSTVRLDRFQKLPIYAEFGVKHCWYVDPIAKTLEVFILSDGTYKIGPTFTDNDPVTAPPFDVHMFELGILWGDI